MGKKGPKFYIMYWGWWKDQNQYLMELWSEEFFAETTFWKYSGCDDLCCDVINSKLGLKKCKLVFHVSTVRERWKSIVQRNLRSIRFLNHYLKILKFWLPVRMTLTSKMGQKGHIGISCNNIDRWKSRVEGTFRRIIHLQNFSLKVLKF